MTRKVIITITLLALFSATTTIRADSVEHSIIYSGGLWLGVPFFPSGMIDKRRGGDASIEARLAYRYHNGDVHDVEFAFARAISWSDNTSYSRVSASLVRAWSVSVRNELFMRAGVNIYHLNYMPTWNEGMPRQREFHDSLGTEGSVGWRYRTDWGELGVDLNITHMHPVRVNHAHFNIGYRF